MKRLVLILLFFFFGLSSIAHTAVLTSLSLKSAGSTISVTCGFSGTYQYRLFVLSSPDRIVLDLPNAEIAQGVLRDLKNKGTGFVSFVRSGHPDPHTVRFVFEVNKKVRLMSTQRAGRGSTPLNFVLVSQSAGAIPTPVVKPKSFSPNIQLHTINHRSFVNKKRIVVVIDPGHGGKDPGARGPGGGLEKNVVLNLAEKLKSLIDHEPGMRAVLTRHGDYYIGLRERMNIARRNNADVFIAIHSDAFVNSHSNGASVFALSQRGATSEAARWLAEKENHSELGGVNLKRLDDHNGLIRTVLLDLSQTATITSSLHLGTEVLKNLGKMTRLHNHRVEQARFVVLKSPDIPSILIETGFISNPNEERNLRDQQYQMRLARAIFSGLKRYFWEYPPHANPSTNY